MAVLAGALNSFQITISGANQSITGSDTAVVGRIHRVDYLTNNTNGSPAFVDILESGTNNIIFRDFGITSGAATNTNYPRVSSVDATNNATITGSVELPIAMGPLIFRSSGGTMSAGSSVTFRVYWII